MSPTPIKLAEKFSLFSEQWSPKIIAQVDEFQFKLAKLEGDFVWHRHPNTDEVFFVIKGSLRIDFRDGDITLGEREMLIVPKGVEHKPYAVSEAATISQQGNVSERRSSRKLPYEVGTLVDLLFRPLPPDDSRRVERRMEKLWFMTSLAHHCETILANRKMIISRQCSKANPGCRSAFDLVGSSTSKSTATSTKHRFKSNCYGSPIPNNKRGWRLVPAGQSLHNHASAG